MPRSKSKKFESERNLTDQQIEKLKDCIWICRIGKFNDSEALAFINSGELGYLKQTEEDIKERRLKPKEVSLSTYYRYLKEVESAEYQTRELFKIFREEYMAEIISRFKLFKDLEAKSIRALEQEDDPHKKQLIINGIFRNSPYTTSLMDIIKQIIERNKMPFPKNPEVEKILEREKLKNKPIITSEE